MAKYEFMLILDPSISEDDRNKSLEQTKKLLKKFSAKVVNEDIWGEKKLAYKINKSENGFYVLYEIEIDGTKLKEINPTLNLDLNIWRYMFVRKDV